MPPPDDIGPRLSGGIVHLDGHLTYVLDGEVDSADAARMFERLLASGGVHDGMALEVGQEVEFRVEWPIRPGSPVPLQRPPPCSAGSCDRDV